jgi:hypothetical protein
MNSVTLEGPVVLLPADEYQNLLARLATLEKAVNRLAQQIENQEDLKIMYEAEAEYQAGDVADFADLVAEVQAEVN